MKLPEAFTNRMKELLGEEYKDYMDSLCTPPFRGIRINTLKIEPEAFEKISPFSLKPVIWADNGYSLTGPDKPAAHPFYSAGLYYIQEPSAMAPAALLPVRPGDRVLDLCAAPGGKATQLGAALKGKGLLAANDISYSRAGGLLKNLELAGITNSLVLSEAPEKLAARFPGFFDRILVDAPCSGEGMFRRDANGPAAWLRKGPAYYSGLQKELLTAAAALLKPGGLLLYSTCTFSPEENERNIAWLLKRFPEFTVMPLEKKEGMADGRPEWAEGEETLKNCLRLWPFRIEGEGHFAALLRKEGEAPAPVFPGSAVKRPAASKKALDAFFAQANAEPPVSPETVLMERNEKLYALPPDMPPLDGLRVLRSGLYLGRVTRGRFEPGQALAMTLSPSRFPALSFPADSPLVLKYLKGETLETDGPGQGYRLICVEGFPLGFGKLQNGRVKNKYYPGWRRQ